MLIQNILGEAKENAQQSICQNAFAFFDQDYWEILAGDYWNTVAYLIIVEDNKKAVRCFACSEGVNLDEINEYLGPNTFLAEYRAFDKGFVLGDIATLQQQINFCRDLEFLPPMPNPSSCLQVYDWLNMAEFWVEDLADLGEDDYFSFLYPIADEANQAARTKSYLISREKNEHITQYRVLSPAPRYLMTVTPTLYQAKSFINEIRHEMTSMQANY